MNQAAARTPLLGFRCVDAATDQPVLSGLSVRIWPIDEREGAWDGLMGPSGAFSWHELPRLRGASFGDVVPPQSWVVEVEDTERRYLPVRFATPLPNPTMLTWPITGGGQRRSVPLYSAATRPTLEGWALVRASLVDAITGRPAAWAVLRVAAGNPGPTRRIGFGVAGPDGEVVVPLRWPDLRRVVPPIAPTAQTWSASVSVFYQRLATAFPDHPSRSGVIPPPLRAIETQSPGGIFVDVARTQPFASTTLRYGAANVLRAATTGAASLFVTPAP